MTYESTRRYAVELIIACFVVALPLSAHAGLLSKLFDTRHSDAREEVAYSQDTNAQLVPLLRAAIHTDPNPAKGGGDIIFTLDGDALVPQNEINTKEWAAKSKTAPGEISIYIVKPGDTLSQIAEMFNVSPKTILWANNLNNANLIKPDMELVILPITGIQHTIASGDTLAKIAKKYGTEDEHLNDVIEEIISYNQLASANDLVTGEVILIPGGEIEAPTPKKIASSAYSSVGTVASGGGDTGFIRPLPLTYPQTQGIHGYNGIDIGAPAGTPVRAAAGGSVIVSRSSGWNGGYGLYVVVKHGNGTQTLYAHLSRTAVAVGDSVSAGQTVGYVGNTGRSTGNHLHFEVRGARNPF